MKTKKLFAVLVAAVLGIFMLAVLALTACGDPSWKVSEDGSVTATLVKDDGEYKLSVRGSGAISVTGKAPWAEYADKIHAIVIEEGVTAIGDSAFSTVNADYAVLPASMRTVGANVFADGTKIFATSEDTTYSGEYDEIYAYSEEVPATKDRYWQSDKSKQNIFDFNNPDELFEAEGKYWHYGESGAASWDKINVLFIGNSFTYRNGISDPTTGVAGIFDNIATSLGQRVETYMITGPGWHIADHAKATDTCGKQVDNLLRTRQFDYIVLQDHSTNPLDNYNNFLGGVKAFKEKIEETQENAHVYLYETWGSPTSMPAYGGSVPVMERRLREKYTSAGEECGFDVSYIGKAFTDIYLHNDSIYLWDTDNRHQGYSGAYLSACVHAASMLGLDVRDTEFEVEEKYENSAPAKKLTSEDYAALRESAYTIVNDSEYNVDTDLTETPSDEKDENKYSLEVAVWGRFITEEQFKPLFEAFKTYATAKGLDVSAIHYTYYVGKVTSDPYYYIANFTGGIVGNGGADIAFACASNFTTQSGTQITSADIQSLNITLNGDTKRCVARMTDTDLSKAFVEFCLTTEGRAILDPSVK